MLKHNQRWAAKLAKQAERQRVRQEREEAKKRAEAEAESRRLAQERTTNPFKMGSGGASLLGPSLFGIPTVTPAASEEAPTPIEPEDEDDDGDFDEEERLAEELAI